MATTSVPLERFVVLTFLFALLVSSTATRAEEFEIASSNQLRLMQDRLWLDGQFI